MWWWIGPLLVYGLLPILDLLLGADGQNPPDEMIEQLENDRYYRWCTYAYIPFQFLTLFVACYLWSLETVNYLEHYGLLRGRTDSGRYERCTPAHSWNSDHICTNIFLYHLQRHSDHHANPTRRYQTLRSMDIAPNLPSGYAGMIMLAYVPPLWRAVMDKRVLDHYDGDITKVNLQPRKREKLLAAYGTRGGAA